MAKKLRDARHLDKLNEEFFEYYQSIYNVIKLSKDAIVKNDVKIAYQVVENEVKINQEGNELHDSIIEYLALFSPMGINLRKIVAYLQIRVELERLGDHCKKMMREVILKRELSDGTTQNIDLMFSKILEMFLKTKESLENNDVSSIKEIILLDSQIMEIFVKEIDKAEQKHLNYAYIALFKHIEKIGDSVKYIYEQSYYIKKSKFYEM